MKIKKEIYLCAPTFELGEIKRDIFSIYNVEEEFEKLTLPLNIDLLGCQYFFQSERKVADLISASIERTIIEAGVNTLDIDICIFSSARAEQISMNRDDLASLMKKHGYTMQNRLRCLSGSVLVCFLR